MFLYWCRAAELPLPAVRAGAGGDLGREGGGVRGHQHHRIQGKTRRDLSVNTLLLIGTRRNKEDPTLFAVVG